MKWYEMGSEPKDGTPFLIFTKAEEGDIYRSIKPKPGNNWREPEFVFDDTRYQIAYYYKGEIETRRSRHGGIPKPRPDYWTSLEPPEDCGFIQQRVT